MVNNNYNKELNIDIYQILSPIIKKDSKQIEKNIINIINNSESDLIIFGENNLHFVVDKNN